MGGSCRLTSIANRIIERYEGVNNVCPVREANEHKTILFKQSLTIMKTPELAKMGLSSICENESRSINGGALPKWLKGVTWLGVAQQIVENWDEIKQGLKEGWNFDQKK